MDANEILTLIIKDIKENIPQTKNDHLMAILRPEGENFLTSPMVNQVDIEEMYAKQNVTFIGILCTNNNVVDPNDWTKVNDTCKNGDLTIDYERYSEIIKNPLVLRDGKRLVVVRPLGDDKNGKTKVMVMGLLAFNKITFGENTIVSPQDYTEIVGKFEKSDICITEDDYFEMVNKPSSLKESS